MNLTTHSKPVFENKPVFLPYAISTFHLNLLPALYSLQNQCNLIQQVVYNHLFH